MSQIETIYLNRAHDLLAELLSVSEMNLEGHNEWVFRGQRDAGWEVVPSAFRDHVRLFNEREYLPKILTENNIAKQKSTNGLERKCRDQVESEFVTLLKFCVELNSNGLHVPNEELLNLESCCNTYTEFITKIGRSEIDWPPKEYNSVIAIAQHYGIPTRFTDWSYDPSVAAFFSAKDAYSGEATEAISVYAVNLFGAGLKGRTFPSCFTREDIRGGRERWYQVVNAPSEHNVNLRAQRGLFIGYFEKNFRANDFFAPYSLDGYMRDSGGYKSMKKFVLPISEAKNLSRILSIRHYNSSTMFPGIAGCVRKIYEDKDHDFGV